MGRPRGRRGRRRQGRARRARPLPRGPRHARRSTPIDHGYGLRFALEPKPNEPRGDILLPTVGHALAFISEPRARRHGRAQPRGRPRADGRASTSCTASPRRCGRASSSTSTSTASTARSSTRTWSSATATCCQAFSLVDLLENGGPDGGPAYDGPRHFDYKPLRTEDIDGVWASAAANMRTYLLLKERAAAFRADPEVQEALAAARVPELARPTLAEGETLRGPARRPLGVRGLRRRGRRPRAATASSGCRPARDRAPARRPLTAGLSRDDTRRRGRLVDPVVQGRRPRRRDRRAGPRGPGAAPRRHRGRPGRLGGARCRRRSTQAGGLDDVAAVAVGGQQHGMVCLDEDGEVVRPALLWNDTRSAQAAADLIAELGGGAAGVGRRGRAGAGRLVHGHQAALAGRARAGQRRRGRRRSACRTTG